MLDAVEREYGGAREGEMWVANDPYVTGTHLNDVTLVRPVFARGRLIGYAANKAHHADVGGAVPGSMPADAAELYAEGLVLPPVRLVRGDRVADEVVAIVRAGSRTPDARSGDLRAQVAGNYTGERRLLELCERYGVETFEAATERALDDSERRMRAALRSLGDGTFEARDYLEDRDGRPSIAIALRLDLRDGSALFDYTGTSAQVDFPLNAVFGVTLSGVYYALRAVTDPTIPMNEGCFRPVRGLRAGGMPAQPAPARGGLGRQRRDQHAQRRRRAASARARRARTRPGVQRRNHEQRHARRHARRRHDVGLLRDQRLRDGRAAVGRRH